jgi:hypothetical protein
MFWRSSSGPRHRCNAPDHDRADKFHLFRYGRLDLRPAAAAPIRLAALTAISWGGSLWTLAVVSDVDHRLSFLDGRSQEFLLNFFNNMRIHSRRSPADPARALRRRPNPAHSRGGAG